MTNKNDKCNENFSLNNNSFRHILKDIMYHFFFKGRRKNVDKSPKLRADYSIFAQDITTLLQFFAIGF